MDLKKKILSIFPVMICFALNIPAYAVTESVITIPKWTASVQYNAQTTTRDWLDARLILKDPMVKEGDASLLLRLDGYRDYHNATVSQNISGLEIGEEYVLSADMYSTNCSSAHVIRFGDKDFLSCKTLKDEGQMTANEWCEIEYRFTYTQGSSVIKFVNWAGGSWYIDNFSLKQVLKDAGGEITGYGEELVKNGSFEEDIDYVPCGEISSAAVVNLDGGAQITWDNPSDADFLACMIYKVEKNEEVFLYRVTENSVTVSGLANGVEAEILIKTEDAWGNISEGLVVKVLPVADPFKKTGVIYRLNGEETTAIAPGELEAEVCYKNNRMAEDR